jgi:hypothetical protein
MLASTINDGQVVSTPQFRLFSTHIHHDNTFLLLPPALINQRSLGHSIWLCQLIWAGGTGIVDSAKSVTMTLKI